MAASDQFSKGTIDRPRQDWRLVLVLWVIVGGFCVVLAHTLAASLLGYSREASARGNFGTVRTSPLGTGLPTLQ